ncbi:MAG: DUF6048 family protein [Lutibacter sp.]|nr:DUF6048 family protein [Lutibacter sp.]
MKQQLILLFFISFLVLGTATAQQKTDTTKTKENYGIRVGVDLSKPLISLLEPESKGLELVADMRILRNYYAAVELGYEDKTTSEDYMNFTTKGSYIKAGVNYNAYKNWKGMTNEIYVGVRYGFSIFDQTLNSYTPNVKGTYFIPTEVMPGTKFKDLSAHWAELVFGLKAETFKNLYLGFSFSFKTMISTKEPDNFKNLYVPGFNSVYLNDTGFGVNYTLSYLIPIIKREK